MSKVDDVDWVLLAKLKQCVLDDAASKSSGVKVDGGEKGKGPVAGNGSASAGAVQKDQKPGETGGVHEPVPSSSPSSSVQQSLSTDQPVPNTKSDVARQNPLFGTATAGEAAVLRGRLAASLGGSGPAILKRKHHYVSVDGTGCAFVNATSANAVALLKIGEGDGYNSRIGNAIRVHRITERHVDVRTIQKQSGADLRVNIRHAMYLRDKVPLTIGTAPAIYEKGTDPPDGDSTRPSPPFNCLGKDLATSSGFTNVAVRNPMNTELYDVFGHHVLNYSGWQGLTYLTTLASNGVGAAPPIAIRRERVHECNFVAIYADASIANPMINSLFYYCWIDDDAVSNATEEFTASFDIEFTDEAVV